MGKTREVFIVLLLLCITLLVSSCVNDLPRPTGEFRQVDFIEKYFKDQELDFIEGVWRWQNGLYEIAIIKNTFGIYSGYEYLGIVTDFRSGVWAIGEPKFLINETSSRDVYTIDYHLHNRRKSLYKTILTLKNNDIAVIDLPYPWDVREQPVLIRTYPEGNKFSKTVDKDALDKTIQQIPSKNN